MKKLRSILTLNYIVLAAAGLLFLGGCTTLPTAGEFPKEMSSAESNPWKNLRASQKGTSELQNKLVEGAQNLVGKEDLRINGKSFLLDCTGVVLATYYYAGIDLSADFNNYTGNGVSRLHQSLNDKKLLYRTELPQPGDIVFWDNTYDRNGDGKPNDYFTHVGMVVTVAESGQVEYLHHNYKKGIVLERMNLYDPDTHYLQKDGKTIVLNSPMRMKGSPDFDKWLSSQLYRDFGMGYKFTR